MQQDKLNKKRQHYIPQTNRNNDHNKPNLIELNKSNGMLKFSRQQDKQPRSLLYHNHNSNITNNIAKQNDNMKVTASFIVPELNLIKIHIPKQQAKVKQSKPQQTKINSKKIIVQNGNNHNVVIVQNKKNLNMKNSPAHKQQNQLSPQTKSKDPPLTSYRQTQEIKRHIQQPEIQLLPTNRIPTGEAIKIKSPIKTLLKSKGSQNRSQSLDGQADKEQLLLLQIKQLKRQNTFLKKKIRDLNKQLNGGFDPQDFQRSKSPGNQPNGQSPASSSRKKQKKGAPKHSNIQNLHLTVNLFFQQVRHLLNSVTQLFRIQFTQQQITKFKSLHNNEEMIQQLNEQICPLRKHEILKKYFLKRKLDRLAFQEQEKRFFMLLNIFTEYYSFKQQSDKKVIDTIDSMIMYTSDLNKWLIQKAYSKKMKSQIQSQKSTQRQFVSTIQPPKFDTLRVPTNGINHVSKNRGATLSPMPKSNQQNK